MCRGGGHLRTPVKLKLNVWLSRACYPGRWLEDRSGLGHFGSCKNRQFLPVSGVERGWGGEMPRRQVSRSQPASCSLSFPKAFLKRPESNNSVPCTALFSVMN